MPARLEEPADLGLGPAPYYLKTKSQVDKVEAAGAEERAPASAARNRHRNPWMCVAGGGGRQNGKE